MNYFLYNTKKLKDKWFRKVLKTFITKVNMYVFCILIFWPVMGFDFNEIKK